MNALDMHYNGMAEMNFTLYANNRRCSSHGLCIERVVKLIMNRIMVSPHSVNPDQVTLDGTPISSMSEPYILLLVDILANTPFQ